MKTLPPEFRDTLVNVVMSTTSAQLTVLLGETDHEQQASLLRLAAQRLQSWGPALRVAAAAGTKATEGMLPQQKPSKKTPAKGKLRLVKRGK